MWTLPEKDVAITFPRLDVERHRVVAAQHLHRHDGAWLDLAHRIDDDLDRRAATVHRLLFDLDTVNQYQDVTGLNAGLRSRTTRCHAGHAGAFVLVFDGDAEKRTRS